MAAVPSSRPQGPQEEKMSRVTRSGKKLTYVLTVIQQPERARACGSGAKSSADRRPVDPPPVVKLGIFEERENGEREDITFSYKANFFLFATLEMARPMAHGRVQQPSAPQIPVLTGMPVSGMAYLDRPTEAGYFIFPDLSVRHEGKYRLSFNLYEETKEDSDFDPEPANDHKKIPSGPNAPDSSFDWRLEVKSGIFTVFSAKKFPGLAESTALSRTVAEQGCRVRIRRDVRMRRRDGKATGEFDEAEHDEWGRGRAPTSEPYRERSHSGSPDGRPAYPEERRLSGEYQPYPQQFTPSPVTPHSTGPPPGGHLGFLGGPASQPQFAQPQMPAPQPYQSAPSAYHHPAPQYHPQPPLSHGGYGYGRPYPYPQSAYPSNPPREPREYESEYRRASVAAYPPSAPRSGPYPAVDSNYNRPTGASYQYPRPHSPSMPGGVNLAPLKMPPIEPKHDSYTSPTGPLTSVNRIAPSILSPAYERGQDRSGSYSQYSGLVPAETARNGKRTYDSVFSSSSTNQPLYNGMRPSTSHGSHTTLEEDEEYANSLEQMKMSYKRADGSSYSRELPTLES